MGKVITLVSQHPGTGKTITTINLSCWLSLLGKKVLIIDLDPKATVTSFMNLDENIEIAPIEEVLINQQPLDYSIIESPVKNMFFVPSLNMDEMFFDKIFQENIFSLRDSVDILETEFDYIFIDVPNELPYLFKSSLNASDNIILCLKGENEELEALSGIIESIIETKEYTNKWLELSGIIFTSYLESPIARQINNKIKDKFGNLLFKTTIPQNMTISEASKNKSLVPLYDNNSFASDSYLRLAREFIQNFG